MVSLAARPRPLDTFDGKDLVDEYIFYDAEGEQVHVLNAVAREIYLLCDGDRSVEDLVRHIVDRFDVDEESATRDVNELLLKMVDLRLIDVR